MRPIDLGMPVEKHSFLQFVRRGGLLCQSAALLALSLLLAWPMAGAEVYAQSRVIPPKVMREMRGVWVASVGNIDWPSTNGLNSAQQKAEMIALLDRAAELKLNTVIFQVRPSCDALYASSLEPWSEYLNGTMGKAPDPFYDPLAFAIEEAHKRGLELHAWFNPYRARYLQAKSAVAASHISRTHPEWVRHYGKMLWLDPGEKGVQAYSLKVVMDVVNRYEIDGVHFDDYFYPYEKDSSGRDLDFPDEASWRRFGAGGKLSRDDWRRENVNTFVHRVYESIKAAKPWVKFGISPFGIWRPGNPTQIQGLDAFARLEADSRKWLANGWVDYLSPQLYWAIGPPQTSFPVLLKWWTEQDRHGRLICPGMKSYNVGRTWNPEEIIDQIEITRRQAGAGGHVHWDMKTLLQNKALDLALEHSVYTEPALVPAAPWLERQSPVTPILNCVTENGNVSAKWTFANSERVKVWVLQTRKDSKWTTQIVPRDRASIGFGRSAPEVIAITSVDRCGNTSAPVVLELRNRDS